MIRRDPMKTILAGMLLFSSVAIAGTNYDLNCVNNDIYTDLGAAKIELNTTLTVNEANDYSIEGGNFKFIISEEGDDYAWTDQNVEVPKVLNYKKYRPRTYKGHAKFPSIGKNFFGKADFLVPHAGLLEGQKTFQSAFILSWVEDHWGGSVTAECTLTPEL
jgi:hypothetical protein